MATPPGSDTRTPAEVVEHFFRHEAGRLTATLVRSFGLKNLALAEDIVQETLLKALDYWRYHPLPDNPTAWLYRAARNRALDQLRRQQYTERPEDDALLHRQAGTTPEGELLLEGEIGDSQLRMMFACCTPELPTEAQLMLILKTLCGFSVREIARAFLQNEEAVAKRLYRARKTLAESGFSLELPPEVFAGPRLPTVLLALYLLFTEGYNATETEDFLREDLAAEALRLGALLTHSPATAQPEVFALLALMSFHAARFPARRGAGGKIVLLEDQDRSQWHPALIAQGLAYFEQAMTAQTLSTYHLEAAIAAAHTTAPSLAATDWPLIRQYYELLYQQKPTPVVALNRAVVISKIEGPTAAIPLIEALPGYDKHHLFLSVLAQLELQSGNTPRARAHWQRALAICPSPRERELIAEKLAQLGA
ncbi:MAG: sigma-70 family RNA polymerase sigma factor [Bacteroidia bacterium]|nr:sigma-70 family RNA polymerase sigma factor [Bacteroidia bacterium]